jgi:hypothetical protein
MSTEKGGRVRLTEERVRNAQQLKRRPKVDESKLPELMGLANEMETLKAEYESLEEQAKVRKDRYREISENLLPEAMELAGLVGPDGHGKFTLASGSGVHLKTEVYVGVRKEDKPALFAWLRKHGMHDLIKEDVNTNTLKSTVKELIEYDEEIPPQVTTHFITSAVLTRRGTRKKG